MQTTTPQKGFTTQKQTQEWLLYNLLFHGKPATNNVVAHAFNPKAVWSTDQVPRWPGLHRETLFQKNKVCPTYLAELLKVFFS